MVDATGSLDSNDHAIANEQPRMVRFYHHTSPLSLPYIFRFGLYLSATRFTKFGNMPPLNYGWKKHGVALVLRAPGNRILPGMCLGFPENIQIEAELRTELELLVKSFVDGDERVATSRKSRELRALVNGARRLLLEEAEGTIRYFPLSSIDIEATRDANAIGRHRSLIFAYLDELEETGGQAILKLAKPPRIYSRIYDYVSFWLLYASSKRFKELE